MPIGLDAPDGTTLVAEVTGSGPPVVFVHGTGGGLGTWQQVGSRLRGHQIMRYARRNHPPSDVGTSPNTFAAEGDDLRAVLKYPDAPAAHVVGGSYGATVALHVAAVDSERVASLALFEPPILLVGEHLSPVLDRFRTLCATEKYDAALEMFAREVARIPESVLAQAPLDAADPEASRIAADAVRADLESIAAESADTQRWASIDVPVLLMEAARVGHPYPRAWTAWPPCCRTHSACPGPGKPTSLSTWHRTWSPRRSSSSSTNRRSVAECLTARQHRRLPLENFPLLRDLSLMWSYACVSNDCCVPTSPAELRPDRQPPRHPRRWRRWATTSSTIAGRGIVALPQPANQRFVERNIRRQGEQLVARTYARNGVVRDFDGSRRADSPVRARVRLARDDRRGAARSRPSGTVGPTR